MAIYKLPKILHPDFITPDKKPASEVEIDFGHEASRGLIAYWPLARNSVSDVRGILKTRRVDVAWSGQNPIFNGTSSYIAAGDSERLQGLKGLTINVEFNSNNLSGTQSLVAKHHSSTSSRTYYCAITNPAGSNVLQFGISTNNGAMTYIYGTTTILPNVTYKASFVWDGSEYKIYLNGVQEAVGAKVAASITSNNNEFTIGCRYKSTYEQFFSGEISYVSFGDTPYSPQQVRAFNSDPYQILKPKTPAFYFTPATVTPSGTITETLEDTTSSGVGNVSSASPTGTIVETLENVVQSSSGSVKVLGNVSYTLDGTTSNSIGVLTVIGSGSETLDNINSVASATVTVSGSGSELLEDASSSITATATVSGSSSEVLEDTTSAISATITIDGVLVETLDDIVPSINGVIGDVIVGNITKTLDDITVTASGVVPYTGTIGSVLGDVVMAASGTALLNVTGTLSEAIDGVTSSASGTITVQPVGSIDETLDNVTSTSTGSVQLNVTGTLSEVLANVGISAAGTAGQPTTLTAQDITNIVDAIFSRVIENSETLADQLKLIRAEAAGKLLVSGTTVTIRDAADTKDRITATVDNNGQRTTVTTDVI